MKLSLSNYFKYYISHPLSRHLPTDKERALATISTVALGILTIGVLPLICFGLQRKFKWKPHEKTHSLHQYIKSSESNNPYLDRFVKKLASLQAGDLLTYSKEVELQNILRDWDASISLENEKALQKKELSKLIDDLLDKKVSFKLIQILAKDDVMNLLSSNKNYLTKAIQTDQTLLVYNILEWTKKQQVDLNFQDQKGNGYLHYLVAKKMESKESDFYRNLQYFLDFPVKINLRNKEGCTPLHLAILSSNPLALELLIEKGAQRLTLDSYPPLKMLDFSKSKKDHYLKNFNLDSQSSISPNDLKKILESFESKKREVISPLSLKENLYGTIPLAKKGVFPKEETSTLLISFLNCLKSFRRPLIHPPQFLKIDLTEEEEGERKMLGSELSTLILNSLAGHSATQDEIHYLRKHLEKVLPQMSSLKITEFWALLSELLDLPKVVINNGSTEGVRTPLKLGEVEKGKVKIFRSPTLICFQPDHESRLEQVRNFKVDLHDPNKVTKYHLVSYIEMKADRYVATAWDFEEKKWLEFVDFPVEKSKGSSQNIVLMFYEKG